MSITCIHIKPNNDCKLNDKYCILLTGKDYCKDMRNKSERGRMKPMEIEIPLKKPEEILYTIRTKLCDVSLFGKLCSKKKGSSKACDSCMFKYYDYIKGEPKDLKPFVEWLYEKLNEYKREVLLEEVYKI